MNGKEVIKNGTEILFFDITAVKGDTVKGTSHTQHIWNATFINGLSESGEKKIQEYKDKGYRLATDVGDRRVRLTN